MAPLNIRCFIWNDMAPKWHITELSELGSLISSFLALPAEHTGGTHTAMLTYFFQQLVENNNNNIDPILISTNSFHPRYCYCMKSWMCWDIFTFPPLRLSVLFSLCLTTTTTVLHHVQSDTTHQRHVFTKWCILNDGGLRGSNTKYFLASKSWYRLVRRRWG